MLRTGRDRLRGATGTEEDRADRTRQLAVPDVLRVAVSERSGAPAPPASNGSVVKDRAGGVRSCGDSGRSSTVAEVDRPSGRRRFVVADVGDVPIPQGAGAPITPAPNGSVVEDGASVGVADRHRPCGATRRQRHGGIVAGQLVVPDGLHVAPSELPDVIGAPTQDIAVVADRTGGRVPGRDARGRPPGAQVHASEGGHRFVVADIGGRAIAQATTCAAPPAPHAAVTEDRTRMVTTAVQGAGDRPSDTSRSAGLLGSRTWSRTGRHHERGHRRHRRHGGATRPPSGDPHRHRESFDCHIPSA